MGHLNGALPPEHPAATATPGSLPQVLRQIANEAWYGNDAADLETSGLIQRTRDSLRARTPQLKEAVRHTSADIITWMHKGGPWRALLVTVVGTVVLLGLAGFGTFMLFFLAATVNAVAIGFLASVASVGAFTALFFTTLTAIYIGGLVLAVVTISTITFFCICAALTAAGWVVFLWIVWQCLKKGAEVFKNSIFMPVAALTTVTTGGIKPYESIKPYERMHY